MNINQAKRDFGSFHSSNIEELIRLDDNEYVKPEYKVKLDLIENIQQLGSDEIKRDYFCLENNFTFLNHGAFGLTFKPIIDLVNKWQRYAESQPLRFYDREVLPLLVDVIRRYANVLNCKPTELVLVENCTFAFNSVLSSIKLENNEKIFIFNTTYGVYKKILKNYCTENGALLIEEQIKFPLLNQSDFENEILLKLKNYLDGDDMIKYVFIDYIPSNHPFIMPVKSIIDLCHRKENVICIVDAAHALGSIFDFNLTNLNADILFGNCHKWFCGPKGTAFLYKREDLSLSSPIKSHGFNSGFHSEFLWIGLKDYCSFLALDGTLDIWLNKFMGFNSVIKYCHDLMLKASEYLKETWNTEYLVHPMFCSTMICVKLPINFIKRVLFENGNYENENDINEIFVYDHAEIIQNYLYFKHNIEVPIKAIQNELFVRISCHIYNKFNDYEVLANVVIRH